MSKHTDGPWKFEIDEVSGACWISAGINGDVCDLYNRVNGKCFPYENFVANAHLIAVAPDMLDGARVAAKVLNDFLDGKFDRVSADGALEILREAIAKAEGKENEK